MVGVIVASIILEDQFKGQDVYLGFLNAMNFVFWAIFIFRTQSYSYILPLLLTGMILLVVSVIIFFLSNKSNYPALIYFVGGLFLIAFSTNESGQLFQTSGMNHVFNAGTWLVLLVGLYLVSIFIKEQILAGLSIVGFLINVGYWFIFAWLVEWPEWFGLKFIPFVNPGALIWIGMSAFTFSIALSAPVAWKDEQNKVFTFEPEQWKTIFAILGHIIVGGLFTIQILNLWVAYNWSSLSKDISISVAWMIYAVTIFLWGMSTRGLVFRVFGSGVVAITAAKVVLYDLNNQPTIHKAVSLFIIGFIILGIAWINNIWYKQDVTPDENTPDQDNDKADINA